MIHQLTPTQLRWKFDNFQLLEAARKNKRRSKHARLGAMAQERALSALELGLGIRQRGFNIFVVGASGTGRTSTVKQLLHERAKKELTPDDVILLYNFSDRDRPLAVNVPPSMGPKIKKIYELLIERALFALEKGFEAEHFLSKRQNIQEICRTTTDELLSEIEEEAHAEGFVLSHTGGTLTLTPANEGGVAITEEEFEKLEYGEKQDLEQSAEKLESRLEDVLRRIRTAEKEADDATEKLERETAQNILAPLFDVAKSQVKTYKAIHEHLMDIEEDMINRLRRLIPSERDGELEENNPHSHNRKRRYNEEDDTDEDEHVFLRYRVNPIVTHNKTSGAPVVQETHPTSSNLIGRIEQRLRAGETITDFTRIRAGALYRANGGYLILEAQDILRDPSAWEGLKRALKNRVIELDDPGEPGRMVAVASLRPQPVPLSLKVILIGTPELYYALSKNDLDFMNLFKVKADFDTEMERSDDQIIQYLQFLSGLCKEEKLLPLSPEGAGRIIEQAVRLAGNQKKLTSRLGDIADIARESNYWATQEKAKQIHAAHVQFALQAKAKREGFIESKLVEDILSNKITIETEGQVVGQTNGMTVIELGSYEFGAPLRITCRVGCGRGEIVDVERETELGGPLHTKGTLILRGILIDRFGKDIPLGLTATLCMEQTYSDIDGDSASLAEACTLFSALANAPIDQRFALTGSIDQRGRVQAIGSVNEKIEGFWHICKEKKRNNINGVIIPTSNALDLMLKEEIVESCKKGEFQIFTVDTLEDTLELLTGRAWDAGGDALKPAVMRSLEHLQSVRHKYFEDDMSPFSSPRPIKRVGNSNFDTGF